MHCNYIIPEHVNRLVQCPSPQLVRACSADHHVGLHVTRTECTTFNVTKDTCLATLDIVPLSSFEIAALNFETISF